MKKYINKLINDVYNNGTVSFLLTLCFNLEVRHNLSFTNTILCKRSLSFLDSYHYTFLDKSNYVSCLKLISNLKKITPSIFLVMNRASKLLKSLDKNSDNGKYLLSTVHLESILKLDKLDKLNFIFDLLNIYKFNQLKNKHLLFIKSQISSVINDILYVVRPI